MKKFILKFKQKFVLLIIFAAILLCACSQPEDGYETLIGVSIFNASSPSQIAIIEDLKAFEGQNIRIVIKDSNKSLPKQQEDIASFVNHGVDAILVADNGELLIQDCDVPIVVIGEKRENKKGNVYIFNNYFSMGNAAAKELQSETVLEFQGVHLETHIEELKRGYRENNSFPEYVVASGDTSENAYFALQSSEVLRQSPKISTIFAHSQEALDAAIKYKQDENENYKIAAVLPKGTDAMQVDIAISYPSGATEAVSTIKKILSEENYETEIELLFETQKY